MAMLKRSQFWVLSAIGAGCVLFAILNMSLYTGNQGLQAQVSQRAQYIQQSVQLQGLYRQIVGALAELSVRNKDPQLRAVLAKQGINVSARAQPPAAAAHTHRRRTSPSRRAARRRDPAARRRVRSCRCCSWGRRFLAGWPSRATSS
jgi:hypothetical protein